MPHTTIDKNGKPVKKGSKIKFSTIPDWLSSTIPEHEAAVWESVEGEVFTVYKVDSYGAAWIETVVTETEEDYSSLSLSLDPDEMELVE